MSGRQVLTSKYVHLPLLFRIVKIGPASEEDKYVGGRNIYLSKVIAEASGSNPTAKVQNALRVHFNNGTDADQFILNVGSDETDSSVMYMPVAGALDLNKDGDYDIYTSGANANKEIIYGEYSVSGSENLFTQSTPATELSDLNNVGADAATLADTDNYTTFLAAHGENNLCYTDYSGLTFETAQYKSINQIKPDDSQAALVGGNALCVTETSGTDHLAELEATIWLEGWDHNVIDEEKLHQFNLGLQFIIDIVS